MPSKKSPASAHRTSRSSLRQRPLPLALLPLPAFRIPSHGFVRKGTSPKWKSSLSEEEAVVEEVVKVLQVLLAEEAVVALEELLHEDYSSSSRSTKRKPSR
jgi:hypothetical protein